MNRLLRTMSRRRGASAVEFALVAPILTVLALGMIDYGFLFNQQSQVMSGLTGSLRAATNVTPGIDGDDGECAECVATAQQHAILVMEDLGVNIYDDQLEPDIINVAGTCALKLEVDVPHQPIVGLIPMPETYRIETAWILLNVEGC